jgi:hypothetical protein
VNEDGNPSTMSLVCNLPPQRLAVATFEWHGTVQKGLFLERAKGYVNAPEKSNSQVLSWREISEHGAQSD